MTTKITVTALSHDDLVDILSTGLYGSSWFEADYDRKIYESLEKKQGDCYEDALADMLLAGHKITSQIITPKASHTPISVSDLIMMLRYTKLI